MSDGRSYNFHAGPAVLPPGVAEKAAAALSSGGGFSPAEIPHRGDAFGKITSSLKETLRSLLDIPDSFDILFLQGGARALNSAVPMNIAYRDGERPVIDVAVTGYWSALSMTEASKYNPVRACTSSSENGYTSIAPASTWKTTPGAAYLHVCLNETIDGNAISELPDTDCPVVADATSDILSRPVDFSKIGVLYASAQKNLGISGLTLVIVRRDLIGLLVHPFCPEVYEFSRNANAGGFANTPSTFSLYICSLVCDWVAKQGGIPAMRKAALERSSVVYAAIDESGCFECRVAPADRSPMNAVFYTKDETLREVFLKEAAENGLIGLAGHSVKGGLRASLYNAMSLEGAEKLAAFIRSFGEKHAGRRI